MFAREKARYGTTTVPRTPPPRLLLFAALTLAGVGWADPGILLFGAVGTVRQVTISGRALKNVPTSGTSTVSKNIRALTSSNWEGAKVEVRFAGRTASVTTGHDGQFEATFAAGERPFEVGLGEVEAGLVGAGPGTVASASVDIIAPEAPFFVISDFDDTLAETHVIKRRELLKSALFKDEQTQPPVDGMAAWYQCLKSNSDARPVFALVSGSPVQFTPRIKTFLLKNGFPFLGLYLRDLGPATLRDYKQPFIRALLAALPQKVVLIGDSGEHDPEVYAQIRDEFPDRVVAIYIRDAGHAEEAARFKDMVLFKTAQEAALDSAKRGLANESCVQFSKGNP